MATQEELDVLANQTAAYNTTVQTTNTGTLAELETRVTTLENAGYQTASQVTSAVSTRVPVTRTVNGRALAADITIPVTAPSTSASNSEIAGAKATAQFVNSSINALAAFYITKNPNGDAFATKAELTSATTFYNGGQVRTPTQNDYCIVLADESKQESGQSAPTTRYSFQGTYGSGGSWSYQYTVNSTSLTAAQLAAVNSGITEGKVTKLDGLEATPIATNAVAGKIKVGSGLSVTQDGTLSVPGIPQLGIPVTTIVLTWNNTTPYSFEDETRIVFEQSFPDYMDLENNMYLVKFTLDESDQELMNWWNDGDSRKISIIRDVGDNLDVKIKNSPKTSIILCGGGAYYCCSEVGAYFEF